MAGGNDEPSDTVAAVVAGCESRLGLVDGKGWLTGVAEAGGTADPGTGETSALVGSGVALWEPVAADEPAEPCGGAGAAPMSIERLSSFGAVGAVCTSPLAGTGTGDSCSEWAVAGSPP